MDEPSSMSISNQITNDDLVILFSRYTYPCNKLTALKRATEKDSMIYAILNNELNKAKKYADEVMYTNSDVIELNLLLLYIMKAII